MDNAITKYGTGKLASLLGITPQRVNNWVGRGVPVEKCPVIEKVTSGALRCEQLRPDVTWKRMPEGIFWFVASDIAA